MSGAKSSMEQPGQAFAPSILREYDIRGIVGETLSAGDANLLGRAFGSRVVRAGGRRICVGYDGRVSSPELEAALCDGLAACGLEVLRIGRGPTPMLYFAVFHLGVDGGIMVTGSHNLPHHNGFKMMLGRKSFFGADIKDLGREAAAGEFVAGQGSVRDEKIFDAYIERLLQDLAPGGRELSVAWDAGNGAAGEAMAALTARLPGHHVLLNAEIDGRFPNHHPDPTVPKNLVQIIETVRSEGCDAGIAFDGDGDRIGVVDETGEILWGDQLMLLYAREILKERPGATIIADVKASQVLFDGIVEAGGKPVMWKTGHSLIKNKMAECASPFAGEMSAHLFFADRYYGFDDALYAGIRLLNILGRGEESLSAFRKSLPRCVNTPEIRFECPDERKWGVVDEVRERLRAAGADVLDVDGVRVTHSNGWWLLRASNTQAALVARCESQDETGLAQLQQELSAQLAQSGVSLPET